jgi:HK97 family phage major capsid protein/HK97 family phage prohead protease
MNRAYAVLEVKSVDEDKRTITGIATTPTPDRMGDIVEPLGVKFKNPLPLLWQHRSGEPVGTCKFEKPTKSGIAFEATIPTMSEPGTLKDRLDEAWQSVKMKLVRGVSIGFRSIEYAFMDDGGIRFIESEVLELSLVTIPANADATIQSIKSFDAPLLAATGKEPKDSDRPTPPAPGKRKSTQVKAMEATTMKKTYAEQIASYEATRAAKVAQLDGIMEKSMDAGTTLDADDKETCDTLEAEVKEIDDHLVRLRAAEARNKAAAVVVKGGNADEAAAARGGSDVTRVQVIPKKVAPGIGFTRFVLAQARAKGNIMHALEMSKSNAQWLTETPEVHLALEAIMKSGIPAGGTGDSGYANMLVNYQVLQDQFIEFLRPLTIIGRLPGLTHVPFNVKIGRQTGGSTVNWVGQGGPKPVTNISGDNVTLDLAKIAGIIVLNDELVRISSPSAELLVRNDLTKQIVQFMDAQFVDPTKAAVTGVSPASITYGVSPVTATGTTGVALRTDMKTLLSNFLSNNLQVNGAAIIMSQRLALGISMMQNALGQVEYPQLTMNGGVAWGLPVVTSEGVPSTGGSPTDGDAIIVVSAPDILLADDGQVQIDISREATLQMDSAPDSPPVASTVMYSLFQNNGVAVRAERYINWAKRRSTAVGFIQNAKYFE